MLRAWLGFERSSNPPNRPISFRFLLRRKRAVIHHPRPSTKRKEEERKREREDVDIVIIIRFRHISIEPFGFPVGWIWSFIATISREIYILYMASMEEKSGGFLFLFSSPSHVLWITRVVARCGCRWCRATDACSAGQSPGRSCRRARVLVVIAWTNGSLH